MTKIIAIEGPDKVGKATQSKLLAAALDCDRVEIPWKDGLIYEQIYAMLKDGTARTYPQAFQAFHAANRMTWLETEYFHEDTGIVVLDRWMTSSYIYGGIEGLSKECLDGLNKSLRPADLTIVLDGEIMGVPEDAYEMDVEFRAKVRQEYLRWALENDAPVVDANRSREVVHEDIMQIVQKMMG